MDFAAINAAAVAVDVPVDLNGWSQRICISDRVDRVDDISKIVEVVGAGINLCATFGHIIWCVQGKPVANTAVTAEHMATAAPRLANVVSVHLLLAAMHAADPPVDAVLRGSDVVTAGAWAAIAAVHVAIVEIVGRTWTWLNATPERMQDFCKDARWVLLAVFSNAMHRHMENGHNWYTDKATQKGTNTFRCVNIAGAEQEPYVTFMGKYGHDLWHFLSDGTLMRFCEVLSGKPAVVRFGAAPFMYNGVDVAGNAFHLVFRTPDSARDRWPLNQIGVSGVVLGLDLTKSMIVSIVSKVGVEGASNVINAIEMIRGKFAGGMVLTRNHITAAKGRLSEVIAFSIGYSCCTVAGRDYYEEKGSLSFFKVAHEDRFSAGKAFAEQIAEIKVSKASLTAAVTVALRDITNALRVVNTSLGADAPVVDALDAAENLVVTVPMSSNETITNIELRKLAIEEAKANVAIP